MCFNAKFHKKACRNWKAKNLRNYSVDMSEYTIMIITAEHDNIYAIQYNNTKWNETKCCEFF
jgi:hypothetical protein